MRTQDNPITSTIPLNDALHASSLGPIINPLTVVLTGGSPYPKRPLLPKDDLSRFSQVCGLFAKKCHFQMKALKLAHQSGFITEAVFLKRPVVSEEIARQVDFNLIDLDNLIETLTKTWYRHQIQSVWEIYCLSGNSAAIQNAIEAGKFNQDAEDIHPWAMLFAAQSGSVEAMQLIHDALEIPWNVCDTEGNTTLHYATASGSPEAVQFLRQQGLNPITSNYSDLTSIELSKEILSITYDNHLITQFNAIREAMEINGFEETIHLNAWVNSLPDSETRGHVYQYESKGNQKAVLEALIAAPESTLERLVNRCHIL